LLSIKKEGYASCGRGLDAKQTTLAEAG